MPITSPRQTKYTEIRTKIHIKIKGAYGAQHKCKRMYCIDKLNCGSRCEDITEV